MRVKVLGCSGGIGAGLRTTAILIDDDILIDAGTGIGDLSLPELRRIRHVFLTHSHLDHTAGLPLFTDSIFDTLMMRELQVYGRVETLRAIQDHIFNDVMWPDFSMIPSKENPALRYNEIAPGDVIEFDNVALRAVNVHHSVPAVGYLIEANNKVIAFSGDTMTNQTLWPVLNDCDRLEALVIEVSFPDSQEELATMSGHYCPRTLAEDLGKLSHDPEIWVTAMKPGGEDIIFAEVLQALRGRKVQRLRRGDCFEL